MLLQQRNSVFMRSPQDAFLHCPGCGSQAAITGANPFKCKSCDFTYYFGPTVAVGGIVEDTEGKILLLRRNRDPGRGKLGLPGGFVDIGETGELAVVREIKEEVGLEATVSRYLTTFVNTYEFRGIRSPVLDIFYICHVESFDSIEAEPEEVASIEFCVPSEEHLGEMAFESNRLALELFLANR